ncbi:MAG: relaxase MobL [Firmicutes bacterium]|nr:relaxase MobL [Bacillota bacterium]
MPRVIVTSRYLKSGASVKRSNLVKYIATRETVAAYSPKEQIKLATENQEKLIEQLLSAFPDGKETHEYDDYKINPTKENASELISELIERNSDRITDRKIFVKYLAERPGVEKIGKHGLFSFGNEEIDLAQAMKNVAEHSGNVWTHVVSLNRNDAERLGYTSPEVWQNLIRKNIPVIAEAQKIDLDKLCWYAAFHNTAHHPHIHLIVYSSDPKQGYLTKSGIEKIRSTFANDIFRDELQNLYQRQTEVWDSLRSEAKNVMKNLLSELKNSGEFDPNIEQLVLKLQSQLKNSKGKKVYGYLQPNVKKTVDQIVMELAKNPVLKKMYDKWCELEQQKYDTYTSVVQKFPPLEENKVFKSIKNAVIKSVLDMEFLAQDIQPKSISDDEILLPIDIEDTEPQENVVGDNFHMNWKGDYKAAKEYLKDKQYEQALELFQSEAKNGNVPAIYSIAKMYQKGLPSKENIPKANEYFAQTLKGFLALESNAGKMQPYIWYHLGRLYNFGYGTEKNYSEAFKWFEKAALKGNSYAQYSLGSLYYYGNGTEQNYEKAFEWYKKSADLNNAFACYSTAKMLEEGIGIEKDSEQAKIYFRRAYVGFRKIIEDNPDDKILYRLGVMTAKGIGCKADFDLGIDMIKQSAELGNEYALQFLEQREQYNQSRVQNAALSMLFAFGKLISDNYNRSSRGQQFRTEHKLKSAIRRKKQALGLKESPLENQQMKE